MDDADFDTHPMLPDEYGKLPVLQTDDLQPRDDSLPVKLTMIIAFSSWRREQLARSLETIARQKFREFELLICDMNSGQDMESVYEIFRPFIRMTTTSIPRDTWSSCPTKGIKYMLPQAKGEVIAIMQPEMMLHPDAFWYLYHGCFEEVPHELRFTHIGGDTSGMHPEMISTMAGGGGEVFVNLRNLFLSPQITNKLNEVNWHADISNIDYVDEFWTHGWCLSGLSNREHWDIESHKKWVWWFVGSAKRTATIWEDMPSFDGHAAIDFFLMGYKQIMGYTEVIPQIGLAYHQEHTRASIAPDRELWIQTPGKLVDYLKEKGRIK